MEYSSSKKIRLPGISFASSLHYDDNDDIGEENYNDRLVNNDDNYDMARIRDDGSVIQGDCTTAAVDDSMNIADSNNDITMNSSLSNNNNNNYHRFDPIESPLINSVHAGSNHVQKKPP